MNLHRRAHPSQAGFTLIETVIAMVIMVFVCLSVMNGFSFIQRQSTRGRDKAFASQKAIQMMEELRGLIDSTNSSSIGTLDDYDDGSGNSFILTTKKDVTDPGDAISGNARKRYNRRVNVVAIPNEPLARRVYVRVYLSETGEALAETVSVLRTMVSQNVPTQAYDVYILALDNVPGWWSALSTLKPMFDNVLADLETRNPGLELRPHWITRLGYGRDPHYTPYINDNISSSLQSTSTMRVYYYPGWVAGHSSDANFRYYVASNLNGRHNRDGVEFPAGISFPVGKEHGGSMADQFNHTVRYPDEERLYNLAAGAARASGQAVPEISLRMLLEQLNSHPEQMKNALIVNLHGELLPMPPMRNYSDAAKRPDQNPGVRVVTHPEWLQYRSSSDTVKLRVYSYVTDPEQFPESAVVSSMTVLISTPLSTSQVTVRKIVGSSTITYAFQNATDGIEYTLTNPSTFQTLITLFNSPLRHLIKAPNDGGLDPSERLYKLEYIPCDPDQAGNNAFTDTGYNLTHSNQNRPKNTARWTIAIAPFVLSSGSLTIETRIGTTTTAGLENNEPANLSRTYVWVGSAAPVTERYQFIGDPRHMPYADIKGIDGFNPWWTDNDFSGDYNGFGGITPTDLWNSAANLDIPRYFQMYRNGLSLSDAIWNSITGYSFYYVGIGGEMGYDNSNSFSSSLQIRLTPWTAGNTGVGGVDEITSNGVTQNRSRLIARTNGSWYGRHWLGELYPDDQYQAWISSGNLAVNTGNFYRANYSTATVVGTSTLALPQKRTNSQGCASFFNGNLTGTGNTYFNHNSQNSGTSSNGDITVVGSTMAADFNFPLLSAMYATRPFRLNDTGNQPPEWNNTNYNTAQRYTLSTHETIYETRGMESTNDSSAILRFSTSTTVAGNIVMNGLSPQANFGSAQIGKLCVIAMLRAYVSLGGPSVSTGRIPQVPMISISSPLATADISNPSILNVVWTSSWTRWDGQKYTSAYSNSFSESDSLTFNVKYSTDNAKTWFFVQDNTSAKAGELDASAGHALTNLFTYNWDVSNASLFPQGSYILRVECYRGSRTLHYSYHQRRIYIKR